MEVTAVAVVTLWNSEHSTVGVNAHASDSCVFDCCTTHAVSWVVSFEDHSQMYIPPEIYGKIAEEVRDSSVEGQRHKSSKTWRAENQTLLALSLVSKIWKKEATRVLWSELLVTNGKNNIDDLEVWTSHVLRLLRGPVTHYATHVKRLTLYRPHRGLGSSKLLNGITSNICEIVSASSQVQFLRIYTEEFWMPLLKHVLPLRFPQLRHFRLGVPKFGMDEKKLLAAFLLAHPYLYEVRLRGGSPRSVEFDWKSLRVSNPLPLIETFTATLPQMRMLSSSLHLRTVTLSIPSRSMSINLASELSSLSSPFLGVTYLSITGHFAPSDANTFSVIGQSFPALHTLEGMEISPAFMDLMKSQVEVLSHCLPALRRLVMQEWLSRNGFSRCSSGEFDRPDDASVEQAFAALPRAFPAIVCAEHHRTLVLMGGIREMKMVFSDGGTVIERRERAQPAYQ